MLTGYYDLGINLPGFDMLNGIMAFERERIRRGHEKMRIEILRGPYEGFRNTALWPRDTKSRLGLLHDVMVPMCRMLPSCGSVAVADKTTEAPDSFGFGKLVLSSSHLVDGLRAGIRPLRAPVDGAPKDDPRLITITLREAEHWPTRNSNVAEWVHAATDLKLLGYRAVIVRDTRRAGEPLPHVATSPTASRDLFARAQLYRSAACNCFVSNGPAWFAMALDVPVLMFRPATNGAGKLASETEMARIGVVRGTQLPNAPPYQRLAWEPETAENIVIACDAFMKANAKHGFQRAFV